MTNKDLIESMEMNPWLVDEVKEFRYTHSEIELRKDFANEAEMTKDLDWEDYVTWRSIIDAMNYNPFLKVPRVSMDLPEPVKEWLYWNNVDIVFDLVQMSYEELRAISGTDKTKYEQVTRFLSDNKFKLRHCPHRTYKIASYCFTIDGCPATLDRWRINPSGNVHTFNPNRPSLYPEWFDEHYRLFCHIKDEEKYCKKIIPVGAGVQDKMPQEFHELQNTLKDVWHSYYEVCIKFRLAPIDQIYHIPNNDKELRATPLYRFIELKKDALRAVISAFELTSLICCLSTHKYINEESDERKLNITELERDQDLQLLMTHFVAMRIDFDNLVWYLSMFFKCSQHPCNDWPINPWIQEAIAEYRTIYSDEQIRDQYAKSCETKRVKTWVDFVSNQALQRKLDDNPFLLTYIKETDLDNSIKNCLEHYHIPTIANLIQFTDTELESLFDGNKDKVTQIDNYLKEHGLHLYHSDRLTYKLSKKIRQLLEQSKKD
ncbi:MAG: hypothetical protein J5705_01730 [Bacteroidaceae bacterium]|nr:hypothetical protein [Bacteroidaceae bacterium]